MSKGVAASVASAGLCAAVVAFVAGLATLAGCGQKGPLVLPAQPASAASAPAR